MTDQPDKATVAAVLLPVSSLVMFFSLAMHMYLSLGRWPDSIGNFGFSTALNMHADLQSWWLGFWRDISFRVWPAALVLSVVIPRTRRFVPHLMLYAIATLLSLFLMMAFAPRGFLKLLARLRERRPGAAANPANALWLQSKRPAGRVAELGSAASMSLLQQAVSDTLIP